MAGLCHQMLDVVRQVLDLLPHSVVLVVYLRSTPVRRTCRVLRQELQACQAVDTAVRRDLDRLGRQLVAYRAFEGMVKVMDFRLQVFQRVPDRLNVISSASSQHIDLCCTCSESSLLS